MCSARDDKRSPATPGTSGTPATPASPDLHPNAGSRGESVIPAGDAPCIWMGAGLISFRLCDREFDCENCPLDASIRPQGGEEHRGESRAPHTFDTGELVVKPVIESLVDLHLPDPPADRSYHQGHTWVRIEDDGSARIGIDAFAAAILGRVRGVVAPHPRTLLRHGRPCAWIDETGGTLTLWAPLSGRLLELNAALEAAPEDAVLSPYDRGWILRIAPTDLAGERKHLDSALDCARRTRLDQDAWMQRVLRHVHRTDPRIGPVLQDGGEAVQSLDALLGATVRHALAVPFFDRGRTAR